MREIKFRAWDKSRGKMIYNPSTNAISHINEIFANDKDQDCVWMLFSGLKDRHGKEIYEGDIIQWNGYEVQNGKQIRPIRKRAIGMTVDAFRDSFIDDCFHLQNLLRQGSNIEVIGNIYDNPELLGAG